MQPLTWRFMPRGTQLNRVTLTSCKTVDLFWEQSSSMNLHVLYSLSHHSLALSIWGVTLFWFSNTALALFIPCVTLVIEKFSLICSYMYMYRQTCNHTILIQWILSKDLHRKILRNIVSMKYFFLLIAPNPLHAPGWVRLLHGTYIRW